MKEATKNVILMDITMRIDFWNLDTKSGLQKNCPSKFHMSSYDYHLLINH